MRVRSGLLAKLAGWEQEKQEKLSVETNAQITALSVLFLWCSVMFVYFTQQLPQEADFVSHPHTGTDLEPSWLMDHWTLFGLFGVDFYCYGNCYNRDVLKFCLAKLVWQHSKPKQLCIYQICRKASVSVQNLEIGKSTFGSQPDTGENVRFLVLIFIYKETSGLNGLPSPSSVMT